MKGQLIMSPPTNSEENGGGALPRTRRECNERHATTTAWQRVILGVLAVLLGVVILSMQIASSASGTTAQLERQLVEQKVRQDNSAANMAEVKNTLGEMTRKMDRMNDLLQRLAAERGIGNKSRGEP